MMNDEYYQSAIARGRQLYEKQADPECLVDGPAPDMRSAYKMVTGTSDRVDQTVADVRHPLARENIATTNLLWVEVSSRRKNAKYDTLCRTIVHAKSGALILMEIKRIGSFGTRQVHTHVLWQATVVVITVSASVEYLNSKHSTRLKTMPRIHPVNKIKETSFSPNKLETNITTPVSQTYKHFQRKDHQPSNANHQQFRAINN